MSTVLILSYHFYPSNEIGARRVTALARYLAANGQRVIVVSAFGDEPITCGEEILKGVFAIPVQQPRKILTGALVAWRRRLTAPDNTSAGQPSPVDAHGEKQSLATRAYFRVAYFIDQYKKWALRASRAAAHAGQRYDARVVIASGPPHSALLAGARAAQRLGIPFVADFRDPWSDSLDRTNPDRRIERRLLRLLERWIVGRSAAVVSTGSTVAALLADRNAASRQRIHVVRNGYDGGTTPPLAHTGGRLAILFAGELYVGRDPFPLLLALEWLLARPEVDPTRVRVTFMGRADTYAGQSLAGWLDGKLSARVVSIVPPQAAEAVRVAAADATVLLNLAQRQHLSVPAKTFEHLAGGREVLLLCEDDCETAQVVAGVRGVCQVDPANFEALAKTLLDLYQRHVVKGELTVPAEVEVSKFSREAANRRYAEILTQIEKPA